MGRFEELLKIPVEQARASWRGETGNERATRVEEFIRQKTKQYSDILGYTQTEILEKLEEARDYSACNYYQEANFPDLSTVEIFETKEDFKIAFPSRKYRCPSCGGISTDLTVCNSGVKDGKEICDWKAYGLFGTLGKGFRFIVKDMFLTHPRVFEIFNPIERENAEHNWYLI